METSLHRELKRLYAGDGATTEVPLGQYRIDAIADGRLVEIQHGALGAIRDKIRALLAKHRVLVVKPIVVRKMLVKLDGKGGAVTSRRLSPRRGKLLDLFDDLVHFTRAFPHDRLTLEVPLVDVEERRYPGHGRRRRWRLADFQVEDQRLVCVHQTHRFHTAADLAALLPAGLPQPFHTGQLAEAMEIPRWLAGRIAYCLSHMGTARRIGKAGNSWLYELLEPAKRRVSRARRAPPVLMTNVEIRMTKQ
jgi:hypothetical protein